MAYNVMNELDWFLSSISKIRVTTAQGKQEMWMFIFPERPNKWNSQNLLKNMGIYFQHRENFETVKIQEWNDVFATDTIEYVIVVYMGIIVSYLSWGSGRGRNIIF